jgi:hypothetical protein
LPSLRNVSANGSQIQATGDGPNNYTDPWNITQWRNYEARSADYILRPVAPAPDCNLNGAPDWLDIVTNASPDCNWNGVPDECDVATGASQDCNGNNMPDECDLAGGTSADCNLNLLPDDCDIAVGRSADCQPNGIPDECDPMENGDFDADGDVDLTDYARFAGCIGGPGQPPSPGDPNCTESCRRAFDYNYDFAVDLDDFGGFQILRGNNP